MIDHEQLGRLIREQGRAWRVGRTYLSTLPIEEQRKRLGLRVTASDLARMRLEVQEAMMAFSFPASWDWRSAKGGKNWTTPIRDQSSCGSCVAFATVAAIESMAKVERNDPALSIDLSEASLFSCGCGNCCGTGWNFEPALNYSRDFGITDEKCFPYSSSDQSCSKRCADWEQRLTKITQWAKIANVAERKNVLSSVGPLVGGMAVYQDFFSYGGGVYHHVTGSLAGYHAIQVVGYSESEQCWICKNSWGDSWGDGGWFKIGYGECDIDAAFSMYSPTGVKFPVKRPDCMIASAAYGSPLSPEVQFLRDVRDRVVRRTERGNRFMNEAEWVYYLFSPQVVRLMKRRPRFRQAVRRLAVAPFVHTLYGFVKAWAGGAETDLGPPASRSPDTDPREGRSGDGRRGRRT